MPQPPLFAQVAADPPAEGARIADLLAPCERPRDDTEELLFTWGHRDKLGFLLHHPPLEACAYDRERLRTYTAWRLARLGGPALAVQPPEIRTLILEQARALADMHPVSLLPLAEEPLDGLELDPDQQLLLRATAAALFDYPRLEDDWLRFDGFDEDGGGDFAAFLGELRDDAIDDAEDDLEDAAAGVLDLTPLDRARTAGELAGLHMAETLQDAPTPQPLGTGLTWSTDPLRWLGNVHDEHHGGMVCDFEGGAAPTLHVTDLTDPADRQLLIEAGVFLPPDAGPIATVAGTNTLVSPEAWDLGTHRAFFATSIGVALDADAPAEPVLVYVDRCAIDYSGKLCRWFRVTDLTCAQAHALLARPELPLLQDFFRETDPGHGSLHQLVERCDPGLAQLYDFPELVVEEP